MSEIFNAYAEIALEKEIITKEAQESDKKEESKEISTTEALYGIKPNGKLDETHIVEQAHPESVVVSPAYDRVNGLVENLLERQDIMAWIALKPNDGKLLHRRYVKAKEDLVNELVRVATYLDMSKKDDELMKLADNCSGRLHKEAFGPLTPIAGIALWKWFAGTATVASLYGAASNSIAMSHGVMADAQNVLSELNDVFEEWPTARKEFSVPIDKINRVKGFAKNISKISASIRDLLDAVAKSKEGLEEGVKFLDGKYDEGLVAYLESYKEEVQDLSNDIPGYQKDVLGVPKRHERHTEWYELEFESTFWDPMKWLKRKTVGYDPDEANKAFESLQKSLLDEEAHIDALIGEYEDLRSKVEEIKKNPEAIMKQMRAKEEKAKDPEEISDLMRFMEQQRAAESAGTEV